MNTPTIIMLVISILSLGAAIGGRGTKSIVSAPMVIVINLVWVALLYSAGFFTMAGGLAIGFAVGLLIATSMESIIFHGRVYTIAVPRAVVGSAAWISILYMAGLLG